MKRFTLLMLAFIGSLALQAQTPPPVLYEQADDLGSGYLCEYFNLGTPTGVYMADDFEFAAAEDIYFIKSYGFQFDGDLETLLTGFSLYIYTDATGMPSSDPSVPGTGLLEIVNLPINSPALSIEAISGQTATTYNFTVDIEESEGTPLSLQAGTYWFVAFPHVDLDLSVATQGEAWYRNFSTQNNLSGAQIINPGDALGNGWTSWTATEPIFDDPADPADPLLNALSFTIYDEGQFAIVDNRLSAVSLYPNPVVDILSIDMPSSVELESVAVFDLLGKQTQVSINENNTINMAQMAAGVYILKLETNQGTMTKKVIKQ